MRSVVAALAAATLLGCAPMHAEPAPPPAHGLAPDLLAAMRADAARRGHVADAEARVVSVQPVTWPDGAIGCPQPGMVYTQMLVPGWLVQIEAGTQRLAYHVGRGGRWLMCPQGQAQPPLTTAS